MSRVREGIKGAVLLTAIALLLGTGFNAVRPAGLSWLRSPLSVAARYYEDVKKISLEEAWSLHQEGKVLFLDARDHPSFQEGHLPGALNVTLGEVAANLEKLQKHAKEGIELIAYCDAIGCPSAAELARCLRACGVTLVKVLPEGWLGWVEAGYPVEEGGMT